MEKWRALFTKGLNEALGDCVIGQYWWYKCARRGDSQATWLLGPRAQVYPPQAGDRTPWESQTPRQVGVICVLSCSISWTCDFYPFYQKTSHQSPRAWALHTTLVAFSVLVMTNLHSLSDPAEPLRRADMSMCSSPVTSSTLTKPFAQNTAKWLQLNSVKLFSPTWSSLWPRGLQHARPPCPSPAPGVYSDSCSSSWWCHPPISSSVVPFSSCPQSFPALGSFQMSQFFQSGGQIIGVSASVPVLSMNIQDWSPLGWTGWISLLSKGLSRVFSNTKVQKHQLFGAQLSS